MSKNEENKNSHKSKIGGQALIEGVMMRGIDKVAMAVRLGSGEIDIETWDAVSLKDRKWFQKVPIIRGGFNFVESMILGYKCLMKSAEKVEIEEDEEEQPSKFEQKLMDLFGDHLMKFVSVLAAIFGVVIAIGLFVFLPTFIVTGLSSLLQNNFDIHLGGFRTIVEGVIKIALFVTYLALVSRMKDIKRVFEYHGAEHKSIACYEAGDELTIENVKKYTRFHPRCGTSFLIIVLIISIIVFSVISWENPLLRVVLKLALLPLVVGIAYEFIKLAGRYDNILTRVVSAPGIWLQRLTTREPDSEQIEVAIASLNAVLPENIEDDRW
ncbi:MAG: hypothetical protein K0R90_45 [Oscillospiraceae bacterium]|nr:hypothetical protein [Oscillospiraceae bacterium]